MFLFCYSAFRIIAIYIVIFFVQNANAHSWLLYKQSVQVDTSRSSADAESNIYIALL